jgi:two-component system response regulator
MSRPPDLLVVDDNPSELELIELAHEANISSYTLRMLTDGAHALEYLLAVDSPAALPRLLLLDLNMTRLGGLQLLQRLRAHERTRGMKVVIFSASDQEADRNEALRLGADGYLRKPVAFQELCQLLAQLARDWQLDGPRELR